MSAVKTSPVIIVENFKDLSKSGKGVYSAGLARLVADDLRGLPSVNIITHNMRKTALDEIAFSQLGGPKVNEEAMLLAAQYILSGSYLIKGEIVTITIELVRVSDQTIIESAKVHGDVQKIQERAGTALFILISLLEQKGILSKTVSGKDNISLEHKAIRNNNAFMYYSMASAKRYNDPKAALNLYKKAIISDPSYVEALLDAAIMASSDLSLDNTALDYIAHAEKIILQQGHRWSLQYVKLLIASGEVHLKADRLAASIDSFNSAINILKYIGRNDSFEMSAVLNNYGLAMRKTGMYSDAFKSYRESLDIKKRLGMELSLPYAETMGNLAALFRFQKKYDEALMWNTRTKKLKEKLGLKKSKTYALTLSNQGIVLCDKKDYQAGLKMFNLAADVMKSIQLTDTEDYARIIANEGFVLTLLNDNNKAIKHLKQAQSIRENINKNDTSEYAETSIALAKNYSKIGKDCDALKEIKKGIVLKKRFNFLTHEDIKLNAELEEQCGE